MTHTPRKNLMTKRRKKKRRLTLLLKILQKHKSLPRKKLKVLRRPKMSKRKRRKIQRVIRKMRTRSEDSVVKENY